MARQIFFIFRTYLDMIIDLIYSFFWEGKRQAIPDLEKRHSILMESAVSLAAKIRNKELKCEDLVNACIERIQSVNPIINAVTDERFEEARKEAKEIDLMIAKGLSEEEFKKKPFLGAYLYLLLLETID
ncbi:hypothetical protein O3G_MSEX000530 [Manduca sexta]|nr:hypothetical protein O3G_MSEX000530 [Manduca sexta]